MNTLISGSALPMCRAYAHYVPILVSVFFCLLIFPNFGFAQCDIVITDPPPVFEPMTVDLTGQDITAGSAEGMILSYWIDSKATIQLTNPFSVSMGTYYIMGTSADGCSVIKPVVVRIYSASGIEQETMKTSFEVYPNPNNGTFTLRYQSSDNKPVEISILDITGKEVYNQTFNVIVKPIAEVITLAGRLPGLYFVRLIKDTGISYKKIRVR